VAVLVKSCAAVLVAKVGGVWFTVPFVSRVKTVRLLDLIKRLAVRMSGTGHSLPLDRIRYIHQVTPCSLTRYVHQVTPCSLTRYVHQGTPCSIHPVTRYVHQVTPCH
jgi:hypothetical protein